MQLSEKQKTYSLIFTAFLKCRLNFQYFFNKFCKMSHFRGPFDKEHGKRAQALLKSASQHFYHIH